MILYGHRHRVWMRFIHRFGYHYAPKDHMPQPTETQIGLDGLPVIRNYHWCQWCGLRGTTIELRPAEEEIEREDNRGPHIVDGRLPWVWWRDTDD